MPIELDYMEYANDAAAQAAYPSSDDYGSDILAGGTPSADSEFGGMPATLGCDNNENTRWTSTNTAYPHWWKYDLGVGVTKTVGKLRIKTYHDGNGALMKDFTLQGSNNNVDWDVLYTGQQADNNNWQDYYFFNSTAYRYYKINITSSWRVDDYGGFFETEMLEIHLQCYSESAIKEQGSYSLKGFALQTEGLNDYLERTIGSPIDLSDRDVIKFDIYASRTGANIKIGIHDSGGVTSEKTHTQAGAGAWEEVTWDISGVANGDKDAIDKIIITVVNADADNTFYVDNLRATGYVMTADAGSYSLTGQTMSPLFNRLISVGAGSYALSGQTVSTLYNRLLSAVAGSYTLTGQDVALSEEFKLLLYSKILDSISRESAVPDSITLTSAIKRSITLTSTRRD